MHKEYHGDGWHFTCHEREYRMPFAERDLRKTVALRLGKKHWQGRLGAAIDLCHLIVHVGASSHTSVGTTIPLVVSFLHLNRVNHHIKYHDGGTFISIDP